MTEPVVQLLGMRIKIAATLGLAVLAVAGNVLSVQLFFSVSFIFGSTAAMLAVASLGVIPAVLVAIAGGLYTLVLWGHPYALAIFTAEALVVGLLYRRGWRNLMLIDLAYWLVLGVPLVLLFYHGALGLGWEAVSLIALKQSLNGLFNTLLAGLILLGMQMFWRDAARLGLPPPRLASMLFHALLTVIMLAGALPIIAGGYGARNQLETVMGERLREQAWLLARHLGTEPEAGSTGWQALLIREQINPEMGVALLAQDGRVLASRGDVASVTMQAGQTEAREDGLAIWLPAGDMASMQRWKLGRYRVSAPVSSGTAVSQVVIEQAAAPLVRTLERLGLILFSGLAVLLLLGVLVARIVSRWLTRPLSELETASGTLTTQIASRVQPVLPASPIQEYRNLGSALGEMAAHLATSFHALRQIQAGLEEQVQVRTAELNRTAYLLGNVLDAATEIAIIATDRDGLMTIFNRGAERLLGYTAAEMVNKQTPAILHLSNEVMARGSELTAQLGRPVEGFDVFVEKAEQEGSETREWTYVHKDGRHIPVSLVVTTMHDDSGATVGYLGIAENITKRKHTETALREQAQHTQAIVENMVDGIITIDRAGIMASFNSAAVRIFGYTTDEVLGQNVKMLMPNPYHDAHDGYLRNYQATGVARIIGIGREVEGRRKDGGVFPLELGVSEITHEGQPMYVGIVRDITERKLGERMKSEFVATVSHELRTPLTSISGALGLLKGSVLGDLPAQVRQMIDIAHKNSERLSHLINDLLDMEKISVGKLHFELQPQALKPLLEQAVEAIRPYGAERRVLLQLAYDAPGVEVRVDGQRLMQVLANLLSNAIKFSPEGGMVEVTAQVAMGKVRIAVADHGPGIPDSFHDRIFQKFVQADSSDTRQRGGTGLGLAITRDLVERMGGRIDFKSVTEEGSTFFFDLPIWQGGAVADAVSLEDDADAPRILVVEDEADVALLLELMLTRAGYRVDIAHTGAAALSALRRKSYDAVSLDLMLPDISGLEVVRQIREQPETVDLPIVVVSAKMEEGRLAINGDFSHIDWLAKPINGTHLLAVVDRLVPKENDLHLRVLHVEDDPDLHQVIRAMVGERFDFELATTLHEAQVRVALERFDVVILDIDLPDGSGWDLLPEIRTRQPGTRVVILSGTEMTPDEGRKVEAVLLKSQVSPRELLDAIATRMRPGKPKGGKA